MDFGERISRPRGLAGPALGPLAQQHLGLVLGLLGALAGAGGALGEHAKC